MKNNKAIYKRDKKRYNISATKIFYNILEGHHI